MSKGRMYRAFKSSDYCGSLMEMTASRTHQGQCTEKQDANAKLNISLNRKMSLMFFFLIWPMSGLFHGLFIYCMCIKGPAPMIRPSTDIGHVINKGDLSCY